MENILRMADNLNERLEANIRELNPSIIDHDHEITNGVPGIIPVRLVLDITESKTPLLVTREYTKTYKTKNGEVRTCRNFVKYRVKNTKEEHEARKIAAKEIENQIEELKKAKSLLLRSQK